MYDLYRRRRAAPNYDEYNPEDWSSETLEPFAIPPADRPLASRDVPDNFPVEAEAGRASGPDAEAQVAATKAQLKSLVEDPDYWRHKKPDAVARVTRAFEAAYGGGGVDAAGKQIDDDPKPFNYAEFAPRKEKDEFAPASRQRGSSMQSRSPSLLPKRAGERDDASISDAVWRDGKPPAHNLRFDPAKPPKAMFAQETRDPLHDGAPERRSEQTPDNNPVYDPNTTVWPRSMRSWNDEEFTSPLGNRPLVVTSPWGPRRAIGGSSDHRGLDFYAVTGTPVHAVKSGTITFMEDLGVRRGGNSVFVRHDDGTISEYLHLDRFGDWRVGDRIEWADKHRKPIGYSGYSGLVDGNGRPNPAAAHLHFSYRDRNGNLVNPELYIKFFQNAPSHPGGASIEIRRPWRTGPIP